MHKCAFQIDRFRVSRHDDRYRIQVFGIYQPASLLLHLIPFRNSFDVSSPSDTSGRHIAENKNFG